MDDDYKPSRRAFLHGTAAAAVGTVAGSASAQGTPDPLITGGRRAPQCRVADSVPDLVHQLHANSCVGRHDHAARVRV